MDIYKVGGAVRDALLGYPHHETDWVVVGATPETLLTQGFTQVGKDFPVFLHPRTKEEYALARTERKAGRGYHGFDVFADPSVTLEEDLGRRDLTINAMAMTDDGTLIDPYGGRADLEARLLRHVSPHFVEDPLRVLRVARFAARYAHLGFHVAPETLALMADIVNADELAHLSMERIWVETERALGEPNPDVYFQVLKHCGALQRLAPAVVVTHGIERLAQAAHHTDRTDCRWAALLAELPHAKATLTCRALKAPKRYEALATLVCEWRQQTKQALREPGRCFALLKALDALRRDEPFEGFLVTLAALDTNAMGTSPQGAVNTPGPSEGISTDTAGSSVQLSEADNHPVVTTLRAAAQAASEIKAADISSEGLMGPALGVAIKERQLAAIAKRLGVKQ